MNNIRGFISYQGEYQVYVMSVKDWMLDSAKLPLPKTVSKKKTKKTSQKKDKEKSKGKEKDKKQPDALAVLTADNIEDWLESRAEMMTDPDTLHDEYLDHGGNPEDCADLLPGIWINIDDHEFYVVDSVAGDKNLENYLPEGWKFIALANPNEFSDYLPDSMLYWIEDDFVGFDEAQTAMGYDEEEADKEEEGEEKEEEDEEEWLGMGDDVHADEIGEEDLDDKDDEEEEEPEYEEESEDR